MVRMVPFWRVFATFMILPFAPALQAQNGCTAQAGILFAELNPVCVQPPATVIAAAYNVLPVIPEGYAPIYLLTDGPDLVVRAVAPFPQFIAPAAGTYHLHTMVYDTLAFDPADIVADVTTLGALNGLLLQGGGELCGALDLIGAEVRVQECSECVADAGSLVAYKSRDCLLKNTWIGATPTGDAVVPPGYQIAYVFSTGAEGTIIGRSAEPWWPVTASGLYRIHTIVYEPSTLDLSDIEVGVTTVEQLNASLGQGEAAICAGVDVSGAAVQVDDPGAGGLAMPSPNVCLEEGEAVVTPERTAPLVVPDGYLFTYVLARGTEHVIIALSEQPTFMVSTADYYSVHTLVYDPTTFDLEGIVPGTSTVAQLDHAFVTGGGAICGSFDAVGAEVKVDECVTKKCEVKAACLRIHHAVQCLAVGQAQVEAMTVTPPFVPQGYVSAYVLTKGFTFIIEQVSTSPSFIVTAPGLYRIHNLVYDPSTLDLAALDLGHTRAEEVYAWSQQGGGSICAALDLRGACALVLGPWWCCLWHDQRSASQGPLAEQLFNDVERLGAVEQDAPFACRAWPNPVTDLLNLDLHAYGEATVHVDVLDAAGRLARAQMQVAVSAGTERLTLPMDGLGAGVYFVRVQAGDAVQVLRVVTSAP